MPTYLPGGKSDKTYSEKLTFRGHGVEGLVELIDVFVPVTADPDQLSTPYAKEVFEILTMGDFPETRTATYEYLPEHHVFRKYAERLTLRGSEIDALREIISKIDRNNISFDAATLIDFVMYKMQDEAVHIDLSAREND